MSKLIIRNTRNADGRTAEDNLTKEKLYEATVNHIHDVSRAMDIFAKEISERGKQHDFTKVGDYFEEYAEVALAGIPEGEFENTEWCQKHYTLERHHVNDQADTHVDLIDILEHICDVTLAGMGRAGHVSSKYSDINPLLLYRAYWNTIRKLESITEVSDVEELD